MSYDNDNDPILPEGFEEGEDIFGSAPDSDAEPTTEQLETEIESDTAIEEENTEDPAAPTTETAEPPVVPTKAKVKVKFNHEERELDEDEAVPYIQKGMNYDKKAQEAEAFKQQLDKAEQLALRMGYKTSEEMLEAAEKNMFEQKVADLVNDGVHEAIARDLVQRDWERSVPKREEPKSDPVMQEIDEFVRTNPGVDKLPEEVIEAVVKQGVPLQVAYERYKNKQSQDELKILKQNQAAAAKAPVAPATKHGSTGAKAQDAFEAGFDSDPW